MSTITIYVCSNPSGCMQRGSNDVLTALQEKLRERGLEDQVGVIPSGCQDACSEGPSITIEPGGQQHGRIQPEDIDRLLDEHLPELQSKPKNQDRAEP
ncbi:MAG: ferredoxin [bacterium]